MKYETSFSINLKENWKTLIKLYKCARKSMLSIIGIFWSEDDVLLNDSLIEGVSVVSFKLIVIVEFEVSFCFSPIVINYCSL